MNIFSKKFILFFILITLLIAGGYIYGRSGKKSLYEFTSVKREDVIQEVNVTGKVKPASSVALSFEKSGRIEHIFVKVGDKVTISQALVSLDDRDIKAQVDEAKAQEESAKAQLNQAQADVDAQEAKLEEYKKGTRQEDIDIANTKIISAQKTVEDAEVANANTKTKAEIDLANLYNGIKDIMVDSYNKADDALNKQIDELFINDAGSSPQLTFMTSDFQTKIDAEWQRFIASEALRALKKDIDTLPSSQGELDGTLKDAKTELEKIYTSLNRLSDAVSLSVGVTQSTVTSYRLGINTARANIHTALSSIASQTQLIAAQKSTNQENISSADSKIHDAKNALDEAKSELALKQAGYTEEQINGQEAQVRNAKAALDAKKAQVQQARASVESNETQLVRMVLRSPIEGLVTKQDAKRGEIAQVNAPLISLNSLANFQIEANVPEADIAKLRVGNIATLTLDAYGSDAVFNASIILIDPAETVIDGVPTYKITLEFNKEDERVKSGMTANITVVTAKREHALAIRERAIIEREGEKFLLIDKGREKPEEVKITSGLRGSNGDIEILSGVKEGDRVASLAEGKL